MKFINSKIFFIYLFQQLANIYITSLKASVIKKKHNYCIILNYNRKQYILQLFCAYCSVIIYYNIHNNTRLQFRFDQVIANFNKASYVVHWVALFYNTHFMLVEILNCSCCLCLLNFWYSFFMYLTLHIFIALMTHIWVFLLSFVIIFYYFLFLPMVVLLVFARDMYIFLVFRSLLFAVFCHLVVQFFLFISLLMCILESAGWTVLSIFR